MGENPNERSHVENKEVDKSNREKMQFERSFDSYQGPSVSPDSQRHEVEYADEITPDDMEGAASESSNRPSLIAKTLGIGSIILSALSLFFLPLLLGAAGIIIGFVARSRGARKLGFIGIILGTVAIVFSFLQLPGV